MDGPQPLTWVDMMAWAHLTGNIVRVEEWGVLRRIDRAFLSALADERADAMARADAAREAGRK
jgi:hypothetical protein